MRRLLAPVAALLLLQATAAADLVVPADRVTTRVVVRAEPARGSRDVGSLRPGETAELLAPGETWRRVRLADGTPGWVSAAWTALVSAPESRPDAQRRFFGRGAPSGAAEVEFVIQAPDARQTVYRNTDPDLPVSGFARVGGVGGRHYDIVLALDASTSTWESARTDVDGDGVVDTGWKGSDSIFRAQIAAARNFVTTVSRLPHNRKGQRIRVGLVTFGGEERWDRLDADRKKEFSNDDLLALGVRDAHLRLPLTGDYAAADRAIRRLAQAKPGGMTDAAAGITRAMIELEGLRELGAQSAPRGDAERIIFFLTDGKPRLPFDKDTAERAALYAGRLAARAGVRVYAFSLGTNVVTRSPNSAVKRMARRTGGRYAELEKPGDIVALLENTHFSIVERVKLANRTSGRESSFIATGIDGSFYGEIPLVEGANEIEVTAHLDDGRRASRVLRIEYVNGRPTRELRAHLKKIKFENEVLVDQIKEQLAREMARVRKKRAQEKQLEVRGTAVPARPAP